MRFKPLILTLATLLMTSGATLAADEGEPIYIGTVFNVAGAQATFGVPSSNGALMALDRINDSGGVLGRDLAAVTASGDSNTRILRQVVEAALIENPGVIALLGLSDPDNVKAAAGTARERNMVFLTSGATSPKLPGEFPDILFLAAFGDNVQAAAGAQWAFDTLGAKTVQILADPDRTYPQLLQGYFADSFKALGGTVKGTANVMPRASTVTVDDPGDVDLVFVSVETAQDAIKTITALRAAGYTGPVLGGDGYDNAAEWAKATDMSDVYFTTHVYLGAANPDPQVAAFVNDYTTAYPGETPTAFAALAYDAVGLMAEAIKNAGAAETDKIAAGLSQIDGYKGITGTISYANNAHIPLKSVTVIKVDKGAYGFVEQVTPKDVPQP